MGQRFRYDLNKKFSMRGFNDKRDMFPQVARALSEIKPQAFIFENVRGLLRKNFSRYFNYIILQLTYPEITRKPSQNWEEHLSVLEKHHTSGTHTEGLKYNVVFRLVNAADYGVPQKRERVKKVRFLIRSLHRENLLKKARRT